MRAVVPHDPHPLVGHLDGPELEPEAPVFVGIGHVHRRKVQIRLVEPLTVHGQTGALTTFDGLAAGRDHPFDEVVLVRRDETDERERVLHPPHSGVVGADRLVAGVPVRRPLEHDDVARPWLGEPVSELVDHDAVADASGAAVQRGFHGLRRDEIGPGDESQHEVVQTHRDHHENCGLAECPALTLLSVVGLVDLLVGCLGVIVERALS